MELGRGQDFSWSATSSGNDVIDIFVETLCGDDTHYRFEGDCLEMETFNAGEIGFAHTPLQFKRDRARARDRLRDRGRGARGALIGAHDAWS